MSGEVIREYAKKNFKRMFREPNGLLKHKYIVPGAIYSDCLWDWDSWLTNIALKEIADEDISEYEKGCIINFLEAMDESGRIPIYITPNETCPDLQVEKDINIHKPCLIQHAAFLVKCEGGNGEWLREYFPLLCRFVDCYIRDFRHENGLYYWINDTAIGVDNDPSTFYRPKRSSASIYLNCLMFKELEALVYIGEKLCKDVDIYRAEAENLKQTIREKCFDEKDGTFYSVDLNLLPVDPNQKEHSGAPRHWDCLIQRLGCWSGFMAMWSSVATPEQAERMVRENLLDEKGFWAPFGVRTLSKYEKMYAIKKSGNPSCWLGPIWGISNYMVFRGLVNYGYHEEARELAEKTLKLLEGDILSSGDLHEYYHPETGEPIMNKGFQNWNLLSINMASYLDGKTEVKEF